MPQNPDKVKLADVLPETRSRVHLYKDRLKIEKRTLKGELIKTLEDAVLFAIQEAAKVPALEKENSELRDVNKKLEERIKELEK